MPNVSLSRIVDGSSFVAGDGTEIKLSGILAEDASGETLSASQAAMAKAALAKALDVGTITFVPSAAKDRYARVVAQVFAKGEWVQGTLLREGWARANPDLASAACAEALSGAETAARTSAKGRWADNGFAIRSTDDLVNLVGTFQVVEGPIVTAAVVNGRGYPDLWRRRHFN